MANRSKHPKRRIPRIPPGSTHGAPDLRKILDPHYHQECERVRILATEYIIASCRRQGVADRRCKLMLRQLPFLLCTPTNTWPTVHLLPHEANLTFGAFVMAAEDVQARNLLGHQFSDYTEVRDSIKAALDAQKMPETDTEVL